MMSRSERPKTRPGRPCSACTDSRRPALDEAIVRGDSLRDIAGRFGTSKSALARHRPHVGRALVRAASRKEERQEETLLSKVERLEADARRLGETAERDGDIRAALVAVRELLEVVKLMREMKPPAADTRGLLALIALETGATEGEIRAEAEKLAGLAADPVALAEAMAEARNALTRAGSTLDVKRTIHAAYQAAQAEPPAPPPPRREEPAPVPAIETITPPAPAVIETITPPARPPTLSPYEAEMRRQSAALADAVRERDKARPPHDETLEDATLSSRLRGVL